MVSTATVAGIGSLLGDSARANMVIALLDGRAWTARELADVANISPQTASSHLSKLVAGQLIRVDRQGRHHYHRLASSEVATLIEQMHLAGFAAFPSKISGPKDLQMRELRSCYDHLAGRIAVELGSRLLEKNSVTSGAAELSPDGISLLETIGVDFNALRNGRRIVSRLCIDWSERRPHLAGGVGGALFKRFKDLGWVRTRLGSRSLIITGTGERELRKTFGISSVRSIS